jgi:phosphoserine phosphatase
MDSTMIRQECIDELADEAGVGAHVAAITARAMNGELDFEARCASGWAAEGPA